MIIVNKKKLHSLKFLISTAWRLSFWDQQIFLLMKFFSSIFLVLLFVFGVHKRVVAPSILVQRLRYVLTDFGLSITESGSLVIKDSRNLLNKDR